MNDIVEFKRMNFFTGFFTTAEDWNQGQQYHLEKRKLHNRTMHTPGIIRGVGHELRVTPTVPGSFTLQVGTGIALDGLGREIVVSQPSSFTLPTVSEQKWLYIVITYDEKNTDYVKNEETQEYSGFTRVSEGFVIDAVDNAPDESSEQLELARIHLADGQSNISDDDIHRSHVRWAGSVGVERPQWQVGLKDEFIEVMKSVRKNYLELGKLFMAPSIATVPSAALTLDLLAASDTLQEEGVRDVLRSLNDAQDDVKDELAELYDGIEGIQEWKDYESAVGNLSDILSTATILELIAQENEISGKVQELAQLTNQLTPLADPEDTQMQVETTGDAATVLLDASASTSILGVVKYHWRRTKD